MINETTKKEILTAVKSVTPVESIIIFGSVARKEETDDSDIDICVVTKENRNILDIMTDIRLALYKKIKRPIDVLVYTTDDFNKYKISRSFESAIVKEGVFIDG
ncbi:MAG: nucleotidyltransferase domain-containing protein [Spirochaetales bacterium]|nr:nucleotidyltransferase domain-containing protein [Spirochaetales bacterium]